MEIKQHRRRHVSINKCKKEKKERAMLKLGARSHNMRNFIKLHTKTFITFLSFALNDKVKRF